MRNPFLFLMLLTGCPGAGDGKLDDTGADDTGGNTVPDYDSGCITVDGGGGYAKLADAVTLAAEGSVIELCDGTYAESVTVEKGVTIRGLSVNGVVIAGPGSDIPLTISGANVTLENLVLESARTGLLLDGATDLVILDVTVASSGSWGVSASDTTGSATGLVVVEPAAGGIQVSGGDLSFVGADIQYPGAYGLDLSDGAVVAFDDSTITGTLMLSDDVSDGYAVNMDDATLSMSGTTIAGADGIGIYANVAQVTLTDTVIEDAYYLAIFAFDTDFDLTGVTVSGSLLQGIYAQGPTFAMTDSSVAGDPELSCDYAYADWGQSGDPWCGALLVAADTIEVNNVSVSGYNNYGVLLQPSAADEAEISVAGLSVDDVGRWGAYILYGAGTVSGLSVTNTREPELEDPCGGYIDQSVGFLTSYSDIELVGATIQDNAGWGMSSVIGSNAISDSLFDGNGCAGFINYQSSATVEGSTFSHGTQYGGLYEYGGVLVATGNTFSDNRDGYAYEYESGGSIYAYEYDSGYGQDILSSGSASLVITGNTFSGGDDSIYVSSSSGVEITDNTWTDYDGALAYIYQSSTSDTPYFARNTADDIVGPVVSSTYGAVEVADVTVGTTRTATVNYTSYVDGEVSYSYSYTTSSPVFTTSGYYYDDGSTIYDYPGSLSITDATVGSTYSYLASVNDARLEMDNVTAETVGSYGIYGSWSSTPPDLDVEGLEIGSTTYTGVYLYGNNPYGEYGSVSLSNVSIGSSGSDGIYARGIGSVSLDGVELGSVAGDGVTVTSKYYSYVSSSGVYENFDAETELDLNDVTVGTATSDGLVMTAGSAAISGFSVGYAAGDGIRLEGPTAASIEDSVITAAGTDGVDLSDTVTFSDAYGASTVYDNDTVFDISGTSVAAAGAAAFTVSGGTLVMDASTGEGAGTSGLVLSGTDADVQGNVFTDNAEYGMTCAEVTLTSCASNDLLGNTLGTHLDCSDACGE